CLARFLADLMLATMGSWKLGVVESAGRRGSVGRAGADPRCRAGPLLLKRAAKYEAINGLRQDCGHGRESGLKPPSERGNEAAPDPAAATPRTGGGLLRSTAVFSGMTLLS